MAHETRVPLSGSQAISLTHPARQLLVENYSTSYMYLRVGGTDQPNRNNFDYAIPPLTSRAIPILPSVSFGVGFSDTTILVTTSVPVTRSTITFYENPTPVAIGSVPLSPGGFRYREALYALQSVANNAFVDRDLSNFSNFRYLAIASQVQSNASTWSVMANNLYIPVSGGAFPFGSIPKYIGVGAFVLEGAAGDVLRFTVLCSPSPITQFSAILEAW